MRNYMAAMGNNRDLLGLGEVLFNIADGRSQGLSGQIYKGISDEDADSAIETLRLVTKRRNRGFNAVLGQIDLGRIQSDIFDPDPLLVDELRVLGIPAPIDPKDGRVLRNPLVATMHVNMVGRGELYAQTRISSLFINKSYKTPFKIVYIVNELYSKPRYVSMIPKRFVIRDETRELPRKNFYDNDQAVIDLNALTRPALNLRQLENLHKFNHVITKRSKETKVQPSS